MQKSYVDGTPGVFPSSDSLSVCVFDDGVRTHDRERDPVFQVPYLLLVLLLEDEGALVRKVVDLDAGLRYLTHDLEKRWTGQTSGQCYKTFFLLEICMVIFTGATRKVLTRKALMR